MQVRIPGDKSISQRALILAGLATGESRIRGLLDRGDPASTAQALRGLGVEISSLEGGPTEVRLSGLGLNGLRQPRRALDLENSGTGARLLLGVLAGQPIQATVTGDESLRKRPMKRISEPLSSMGAQFRWLGRPGCLPVEVHGGNLQPLEYRLPVASAQVKSAILLAGLAGQVPVSVWDPGRSRDHTERMLVDLDVTVESGPAEGGWVSRISDPPGEIPPLDVTVPGDFSSAAFFLLFGLLHPATEELRLPSVGTNPTRTGLLQVLRRMGGEVLLENERGTGGGEPQADIVVRHAGLKGTEIKGDEIPGLIDEVPVIAAGAALAEGTTRITGARELRVKETDRIRALVSNLRNLGVDVEELDDGLEVRGVPGSLRGSVQSFGDHRIAMAFGVLGALPGNEIEIRGHEVTEVSFPNFWSLLRRTTKDVEGAGWASRPGRGGGVGTENTGGRIVITLDGPAGSGKSTTAREVAARLGYTHLDSGALYRALTFALLEEGVPEEEWGRLTPEALDRFQISLRPRGSILLVLWGDRVLEEELRYPRVTAKVSPLSALPAVRAWLLGAQRRAGKLGGIVADGRDMGTVVFPEAEVKVFLTADLKERARRRFLEREGRSPTEDETTSEAEEIAERDTRDSSRAHAPLRKPDGALEVDTSELDFEEQVEIILNHVKTLTEQ